MNNRVAIAVTFFVIIAALFFGIGSQWTEPTVVSTTPSKPAALDIQLSDPAAKPEATDVFRRLSYYSQSENVLSGQNVGHMSGDLTQSHYRTWIRLTKFRFQPAPAVMAFDLGLDDLSRTSTVLRQLAKGHVDAGGFISISMHPGNPWTGGSYDDTNHGSFEDLMTSGTEANRRWTESLDAAAKVLVKLQEEQIPVLWRPLHEVNGDWFWWCIGGDEPALTPDQYKQLWKSTVAYFQNEHQLHNLIWVYAPNSQTGPEVASWSKAYPGRDCVDIAGIDYYGPDLSQVRECGSYDEALATGKMVALSEFGHKPMDGTLDGKAWLKKLKKLPNMTYFVFWHSWPDHLVALGDNDDAAAVLSNDVVENLNDTQFRFESDDKK